MLALRCGLPSPLHFWPPLYQCPDTENATGSLPSQCRQRDLGRPVQALPLGCARSLVFSTLQTEIAVSRMTVAKRQVLNTIATFTVSLKM